LFFENIFLKLISFFPYSSCDECQLLLINIYSFAFFEIDRTLQVIIWIWSIHSMATLSGKFCYPLYQSSSFVLKFYEYETRLKFEVYLGKSLLLHLLRFSNLEMIKLVLLRNLFDIFRGMFDMVGLLEKILLA
jgi:hypothetical protein